MPSLHLSSFLILYLFLSFSFVCLLSFTHHLYHFAFVYDVREHGNAYFITYRVHCSVSGSFYFFASSFSTLYTSSTYHIYVLSMSPFIRAIPSTRIWPSNLPESDNPIFILRPHFTLHFVPSISFQKYHSRFPPTIWIRWILTRSLFLDFL